MENTRRKRKKRPSSAKKSSKSRTFAARGCLVVIIALIAIVLFMLFTLKSYLSTDMSTGDESMEISVEIPDGATVSEIADLLENNNVIDSAMHFKFQCKLNSEGSEFKSGYYIFTNDMEFDTIVNVLNSGAVDSSALRLTVKEGMWLTEIADEVASLGICSRDEFIHASNSRDYDYDFVKDIPDRDNLLEGYLYPDTYFLYDGMTAHDIVDMLLNEFNKKINNNDIMDKLGDKTLDEAVIIASLIEAEVKYEPERRLVSSVIHNRLKDNIKLQIDASVIYSLGERRTRVFENDLKTASDYNTYYVDGLPKGPINCPRIESIIAACEPENTEYLFYVVEDTDTGQHAFCETYEEFLAAKKKYLARVN